MRRMKRAAGLAIVGLAALAAGYYLARSGQLSRVEAPAPAPRTAATPVPETRPLFALADAAGRQRSIAEWDGKALVINFWATWCPPCRREIPLLNALHAEFASRGVEVVGVAVDFREDVLAYLRDTPVDYPMLIGEQDGLDAMRAFGLETTGFPITVFTDQAGRIVTVHVGELHRPEALAILAAVEGVGAGQLDMEAARSQIRSALAGIDPHAEH
jgi:thiol-disulfide isomerase/thioredoxin